MAATSREGLLLREGREVTRSLFARDTALVWPVAEVALGVGGRLQRLRTGTQRARQRELRHGPLRDRVRRLAAPRGRDRDLGNDHAAMAHALEATYEAMPNPKLIILFGACAISGGIFQESDQLAREFIAKHKVDLYIPGCRLIRSLSFMGCLSICERPSRPGLRRETCVPGDLRESMELNSNEVAALLGTSESEVRQWAHAGKLPHLEAQGRLRFNRQAILEWALACGHPLNLGTVDEESVGCLRLPTFHPARFHYGVPGRTFAEVFRAALDVFEPASRSGQGADSTICSSAARSS